MLAVAWVHTYIHESEYRGHPFVVSGNFPSTYHQRSVQSCSSMIPNARISLVNVCLCLNANGIMPCLHDLIIMEMIWRWCVHNVSLDLQIKSYTIHHNLDLSVCDTYFLIRGSMVWCLFFFSFLGQRSNVHRQDFHFSLLFLLSSVLTITSFTLERYLAICHPIRGQRSSRQSHVAKVCHMYIERFLYIKALTLYVSPRFCSLYLR